MRREQDIFFVVKRGGEIVELQLEKITVAAKRTSKAAGKSYTDNITELLSIRVTSDFQGKMEDGRIPAEDVQDSVGRVLEEVGYTDVAKAYILYRKQREKIRNLEKTILDYKGVADNYMKVRDWRTKKNSTIIYPVNGLALNNSGAVTTNCWPTEIYGEEASDTHLNGGIHIHNLSMLTSYNCGRSLKKLLLDGLGGIAGKITAPPIRHLATLCNQMANFLGIMQNRWVASQSPSSFNTYLAPFVKLDNLSYNKVKKCMEAPVSGINTPSRWGTQTPLSHIPADLKMPKDMAGEWAIVGGKQMDFTYGDCQEEMDIVNEVFLGTVLEGDASSRGFRYPIPAYGVMSDFGWPEAEQNRLLFPLIPRYGTPYFINCTRSGLVSEDVGISCQETWPDLHVLHRKAGGFFGHGEHTEAIGVVMISLSRVAFQPGSGKEFYERLDHLMDLAACSLDTKEGMVSNLLKNGLYPYTACYLSGFDSHFSSIGVIGVNEAGLNAPRLRIRMRSEKTRQFAVSVLNHMKGKLIGYQLEYRILCGLEATPAKLTTFRFTELDRERSPRIGVGGRKRNAPYYTNSTKLPVDHDIPLEEALANQDEIQSLYTTRTALHIYVEQELEDWKKVRGVVFHGITGHTIPYYMLSSTHTICQSYSYLSGRQKVCPKCDTQADIYSRIAGYYGPVHDWSDGKAQEFRNEVMYRTRY